MGQKVGRREFLKRLGLGAGGLLLASPLLSKVLASDAQAGDLVNYAVSKALENGAVYADAFVGKCEIAGKTASFGSTSLLERELLGMRICTPEKGWRNVVIGSLDKESVLKGIRCSFDAENQAAPQPDHWITAEFDHDHIRAEKSSHPELQAELGGKWMRYAERSGLPRSTDQFLFCDLLLTQ